MRAKHARTIRAAIISARRYGWSRPAKMRHDRYEGLQYVDRLYGRAWQRAMRSLGLYPPKPPKGPGGASMRRSTRFREEHRLMDGPPTPKYRYTVTIDASSHDEIETELLALANGGYLADSQGYRRDEFHCVGGKTERQLEHTNPHSTPEQYRANLDAWWRERKSTPASPDSGREADQ